jgi:hypothetical protein
MIELTIDEKINPCLERVRLYKQKNKDMIKEKNKAYKERNKDRIKADLAKLYTCICGCRINYNHRKQHECSNKHTERMGLNTTYLA